MKKELKSNIIFSFGYQFIMLCFPLIITPYISRVLGPEGIGKYSFHFSIAHYFVIFAMLGLANYGNRAIATCHSEDVKTRSITFWEIFSVQVICSITMVLVNVAYILFFSTDKQYDLLFLLYTISTLFDVTWFYYGIELIRPILIRTLLIKIITTILIFVFVNKPTDLVIYSVIMLSSTLISQMVLWLQIKKHIIITRVNLRDSFRKHFKGDFVLFIPVIAVSIFKFMDKIMLGAMGSNLELGFYDSVERIVNIPVAIVTALGMVMLPRITNLNQHGGEKTGIKYMKYSIAFTSFLSFGLVFGMLGVIDLFVPLFFGSGYDKCIILSFFMIPTVVFLGLSSVYRTQYLIPRGMDKTFIISVILGAIVNLVINMILIPSQKSIGAAIGTFFAELSVFLYQLLKIDRKEKIIQTTMKGIIFAPGSIIMFILMRYVPPFSNSLLTILEKIMIGGFFYLIFSALVMKFIYKTSLKDLLRR